VNRKEEIRTMVFNRTQTFFQLFFGAAFDGAGVFFTESTETKGEEERRRILIKVTRSFVQISAWS